MKGVERLRRDKMSLVLLQSKIQARDHRTPKNAALGWPNVTGLLSFASRGDSAKTWEGMASPHVPQAEWTVELRVKEQVWRAVVWIPGRR